MYAVTVNFRIHDARIDEFMPLMVQNARTSVKVEPGCLHFDVCHDDEGVFLYELYENRAAFEAHMASEHFKSFSDATADMVADKQVRLFSNVVR